MKSTWNTLSIYIRLGVVLTLVAVSVILKAVPESIPILGPSVGVAAILLWFIGAFELRLTIGSLLLLLFLSQVYIVLFALYMGLPLQDLYRSIQHIPAFLAYLLGAIVAYSGIRLSEWVSILRYVPLIGPSMASVIIGVSTAITSLAPRRTLEAWRTGRPKMWFRSASHDTLLSRCSWLVDSVEILFVVCACLQEDLVKHLDRWRKFVSTASQSDNDSCKQPTLNAVYGMVGFAGLYDDVFGRQNIAQEWRNILTRYVRSGSRVLDVGAGTGRISELLRELGASIDAVEENAALADLFKQHVYSNGQNSIKMLFGSFPSIIGDNKYDMIVLHQNVMIELINEFGLTYTLNALARAQRQEGLLIFDYPTQLTFPTIDYEETLVKQYVEKVGDVQYGYRYGGESEGLHSVTLSLHIRDDKITTQSLRIGMTIPSSSDLLKAASANGFRLMETVNFNGITFFPSPLCSIYTLQHVVGSNT